MITDIKLCDILIHNSSEVKKYILEIDNHKIKHFRWYNRYNNIILQTKGEDLTYKFQYVHNLYTDIFRETTGRHIFRELITQRR